MIDIGNDNLDNELNIEKYKDKSTVILKNGVLIDLRTEEEINIERNFWIKNTKDKMFMTDKNNPKELEYWRNIFPTKTDNELEEYRVKWSKENPKYLKFKNL